MPTPEHLIIVGGVAGGATAAAKARRISESVKITMIERGPYVSFANCGLPYYLSGEIEERDELLLMDPDSFWKKYRVEVRVETEVVSIDRAAKTVKIRSKQGESTLAYTSLLLSPGAQPILPSIPGLDLPQVFSLRSIPDMDRIHAFITERTPARAVVIGGGYVGLEVAEAFHARGMQVHVVEMAPHIMPPIDADMAALFTKSVLRPGFEIHANAKVASIDPGFVTTEDGKKIEADLVLVSAGVKAEVELAKAAGLTLGSTGGIAVDARMMTSDPAIAAVGDACETFHRILGTAVRMPLAGPANRQARVAAINLLGGAATFKGVTGTSIVKLFDKAAGITGLSLKAARQANLKVLTSTTADYHHASYYPDAEMLVIKLVFLEGSGRLIGAQVIGAAQGGVDKRLDVLATAIQAGMTVQDLSELDLVYAPPFGSANDPVNVAGSVAQHILVGDWKNLESVKELPANALLIDVRDEDELELSGKLTGAINVPLGTIRDRLTEIPRDRPVVLYCAKGLRGYLALRILAGNGRNNLYNLSGGFRRAAASGWPVQK